MNEPNNYVLESILHSLPSILLLWGFFFILSELLFFGIHRYGRVKTLLFGMLLWPLTAALFLIVPEAEVSPTGSFGIKTIFFLGLLFLYPALPLSMGTLAVSFLKNRFLIHSLLLLATFLLALPYPLWALMMACGVYSSCL